MKICGIDAIHQLIIIRNYPTKQSTRQHLCILAPWAAGLNWRWIPCHSSLHASVTLKPDYCVLYYIGKFEWFGNTHFRGRWSGTTSICWVMRDLCVVVRANVARMMILRHRLIATPYIFNAEHHTHSCWPRDSWLLVLSTAIWNASRAKPWPRTVVNFVPSESHHSGLVACSQGWLHGRRCAVPHTV